MYALYINSSIGFVNAFVRSPIIPRQATTTSTFGRGQSNGNTIFASTLDDLESTKSDNQKLVLVLGGSGYIGRRICKELIEATMSDEDTTTRVVSISRNGKPPSWALDDPSDCWSDKVEWIRHNITLDNDSLEKELESIYASTEACLDTTIVGCIGNVNPTPKWEGLWGLDYDDERLLEENGGVYEVFLNQTESLQTKGLLSIDRCVLLSLDYISQKCWEGPIEGYLDGKRLAERRLLEAVTAQHGGSTTDASNLDRVVVVGLPNFVYGGKRFPTFGKIYRKIVESPIAKAYVGGNQAVRSLSAANPEDWVEAMLFSSPIDVESAAKATAMAAKGLVTRDIVNNGEPRKQEFFNTSGLPVEYDDILFLDGTHEIEALVEEIEVGKDTKSLQIRGKESTKSVSTTEEPLWEGALIGKRPYLYPLPVAFAFLALFWGISTSQFVAVASTSVI